MKKRKKDTLLWKMTHSDTGTVSYVFGSIHLRDERVYFRIDEVKALINKCDVFIAEYPLDDAGSGDVMSALQLPEGKHINSYLPEKKYVKLRKYLYKSFNIDLDRIGFFRPMVIENMITESIFKNDYEFPMDIVLWNYAKNLGKETLGAETTESQVRIMKRFSIKKQLKSLMEIGRNTKRYRKKIKKLISLYCDQNIKELHRKTLKSLGKMKDVLVHKRNIDIVETFAEHSVNSSVFLAVGAGHLLGKKGIIKLLKEKGYKVKPIY